MSTLARCVQERKLANGLTAYYYSPPRDALKAGFMRPEALGTDRERARLRAMHLNRQLDNWRKGEPQEIAENGKVTRKRIIISGTVDALIEKFLKSQFVVLNLKPISQAHYKQYLWAGSDVEVGGARFGSMKASEVRHRHADEFYSRLVADKGQSVAFETSKIMRRCFTIGVRWEMLPSNPFSGLEMQSIPRRETTWTPTQIERVVAQANVYGKPSIGRLVRLAYATAQRPKDLIELQKKNYDDATGLLTLRQSKTGTEVSMPLDTECAQWFNELQDSDDHLVLNEHTNKPYTRHTFTDAFRRVMRAAGMPEELQFRDLRRSVLTEMGNAGCTSDELRSISGHKTLQMLEVYVNKTVVQATNGLNKLAKLRAGKEK